MSSWKSHKDSSLYQIEMFTSTPQILAGFDIWLKLKFIEDDIIDICLLVSSWTSEPVIALEIFGGNPIFPISEVLKIYEQ